jgi:hypothetical protein
MFYEEANTVITMRALSGIGGGTINRDTDLFTYYQTNATVENIKHKWWSFP